MPALRRPHDRHRGLRARLPAKVAADPKHDRHIMSQTACERRRLPVPLRWPHAGGDLSRRNPRQSTSRSPVDTLHAATEIRIARVQAPLPTLSRSPRATFAPTIITGATIKSSKRRPPARRPNLPATSCPGAFWTPAAGARAASRHACVQKPAQDRSLQPASSKVGRRGSHSPRRATALSCASEADGDAADLLNAARGDNLVLPRPPSGESG